MRSPRRRWPPLAWVLALVVFLPGCYGLHVTGAQLAVVWGREDIADVLEEPELDPERRAKLELVLDARRYAIEVIGLSASGSYTQIYDTGGEPIAWNVSASAPDALAPYAWWFPVVGTLPYVGFFERELARAELARLRAEGLDALLLAVPAYSTLGWFDDPVFSGMLDDGDPGSIVETVIHELAHATVWIDGDGAFNETLATFVGQQGAEDYLLAEGGPADPRLLQLRRDQRDSELFNTALGELRAELRCIYEASGRRELKLGLKRAAFARFRRRYAEELRPRLAGDGYDFVLDPELELNNALVLAFQRYHGELDTFRALHARAGGRLRDTVQLLSQLEDEEDPRAALEALVGGGR